VAPAGKTIKRPAGDDGQRRLTRPARDVNQTGRSGRDLHRNFRPAQQERFRIGSSSAPQAADADLLPPAGTRITRPQERYYASN